MLTKQDCMSILVKLNDTGVDINPYMKKLLISKDIPTDVLRFIVQNKGMEVVNFYEMLRKKHNQKKSPLYLNILKEQTDISDMVVTLSCLLTQITLWGNKLTDQKEFFFKEVRAAEITKTLTNYFDNYDATDCINLLKLIKTDLLVLEYLNGRRELSN